MRRFSIAVIVSVALVVAYVVGEGQREAEAIPALQLPWPTGVAHNINGGTTYGCPPYHINSSYYAIDFNLTNWDSVSATAAGQVIFRRDSGDERGIFVEIGHEGGYRTRYLHLTAWADGIQEGGWVSQGQLIGYAGGTGGFAPHLHFDMKYYDQYGSPYAHRAEPMSGISGFGWYGYSVENAGNCAYRPNDPSPPFTSQPPVTPTPSPTPSPTPVPCPAPPGGVVNGGVYREEHSTIEYIVYDNARYKFLSDADFEAMGFDWDDLVCVPDGYWSTSGVATYPPNKTLVQEFQTSTIYLVQCKAKFDATSSWQTLVSAHYANSPVRVVPPGSIGLSPVPEGACFSRMYPVLDTYYIACFSAGAEKWLIPTAELVAQIFEYEVFHVLPPNALDSYTSRNDPIFCEDGDSDGVKDGLEMYVGTRWDDACGIWGGEAYSKAWMPDLLNDNTIDILDVLQLNPVMNKQVPSEAPYRYDLNATGNIDILDVLQLKPFFGQSCIDDSPDAPDGGDDTPALGPIELMAIDADVDSKPANSATEIGTIESCGSLNVKESLTFDVVVAGVPEVKDGEGGLRGFQFSLHYNPALLRVTAGDSELMLATGGGSLLSLGDTAPDDDGEFVVAVADLAERPAVSGEGVLVRITVEALAAGTSDVVVSDIVLADEGSGVYTVGELSHGQVVIGGSCGEDRDGAVSPRLLRKLQRIF